MSYIAFKPYSANIDDNVNSLIAIFQDILDRHAPLRPMSKKRKMFECQTMDNSGRIFNSIKTKNKLF